MFILRYSLSTLDGDDGALSDVQATFTSPMMADDDIIRAVFVGGLGETTYIALETEGGDEYLLPMQSNDARNNCGCGVDNCERLADFFRKEETLTLNLIDTTKQALVRKTVPMEVFGSEKAFLLASISERQVNESRERATCR